MVATETTDDLPAHKEFDPKKEALRLIDEVRCLHLAHSEDIRRVNKLERELAKRDNFIHEEIEKPWQTGLEAKMRQERDEYKKLLDKAREMERDSHNKFMRQSKQLLRIIERAKTISHVNTDE